MMEYDILQALIQVPGYLVLALIIIRVLSYSGDQQKAWREHDLAKAHIQREEREMMFKKMDAVIARLSDEVVRTAVLIVAHHTYTLGKDGKGDVEDTLDLYKAMQPAT